MKEKIGSILVRLGYITDEQLRYALEKQQQENFRRRIGDILIEMVLKEHQLAHALSVQFGLPLAKEEDFPQDIPIRGLSYEFLKKYNLFPLAIEDGIVKVAISDPLNLEGVDKLEAGTGLQAVPYIAPRSLIARKLDSLFASRDSIMKTAIDNASETISETEDEIDHLKDLAQEKGIIRLVNLIIENAVKDRASDIHIEPSEEVLRIRYRIDGVLYDRETLPLRMHPAIASRIKLLAGMNIAERRLPQDGRIEGTFAEREIDIRVSTIPTIHGEGIVMRLLDRERSFISLEALGFDNHLLKKYEEIIKLPYGMVLITGPTGSGKSTTLYATLDKLNSPEKKIITIEDPVEYMIEGVNQIQVKPQIGLNFATGLRHILRQDPDIIMVGEIRDPETASIAVHAALTGHMLFSTLHTNDSASAVTRLIDMGVENYLVSSTLVAVLAQRLVRRICPYCKEPVEIAISLRDKLGLRQKTLYKGRGCRECSGTGYRGRIGVFELLEIDDDIRQLILKKSSSSEIMTTAKTKGMRTLQEDGLEKALAGITSLEEVVRVTQMEGL